MSFFFNCPWCDQKFDCDDSFDGKDIKCPNCKKRILIKKKTSLIDGAPVSDDKKIEEEQKQKNNKYSEKYLKSISFIFKCPFCDHKKHILNIQEKKPIICENCHRRIVPRKPQSIKEKVIEVIVTALIVWGSIGGAIALLFFACSPEPKYGGSEPVDYITPGRRHDTTSSGSGSSSLITRSQVIAETRRVLDMACSVNGASYSGFTVDFCIISGDKAVCHFSLTEKGMRKTGAIEFNIRGGDLIPSGKYYLD